MLHVIVELWLGKIDRQKRRLAHEITQSVMSTLSYGEESASAAFREFALQDWKAKAHQTDIVGNEEELYKKSGYGM